MEGSVERLLSQTRSSIVTDELSRILTALRDACPKNSEISFDFDGELHAHIDIRKMEDVMLTEAIVSTLYMGIFDNIRRGSTPHRAFSHRVSARVRI